jgi:ankyrin repeat protein
MFQSEIDGMTLDEKRDYRTDEGDTLLHLAAREGRDSQLLHLLADCGIDVNTGNNREETAALVAARENRLSSLNILVQFGADLELYDRSLDSPLLWAAYNNNFSVVRALVDEYGVDMSHQYIDGKDAIRWAILQRNVHIIDLLLDRDSLENMNKEDTRGLTLVQLARLHCGEGKILESLQLRQVYFLKWVSNDPLLDMNLIHLIFSYMKPIS